MAIIQRPGKEGNATTYQGKVAAGYTKILAQEVDADIDALFTAWNQGVDTVNIKPGAVGPAQIAPGAVTSAALGPGAISSAALAAGSVTTTAILDGTILGADIAPGALTDSLIANVAWTKLIPPFISQLEFEPRGMLSATGTTTIDLWANDPGTPNYDGTKPTWLVRLDYTADAFLVLRAPPPGTALVQVFGVKNDGTLLQAGSVIRAALGVNAVYGGQATTFCPAGYTNGPTSGFINYMTVGPITTRGGLVLLTAQHNLSCSGSAGGGIIGQRWLRGGTQLFTRTFVTNSTSYVPLPGFDQFDNPTAGTWTYTYQLSIDPACFIQGTAAGNQGYIQAVEIG